MAELGDFLKEREKEGLLRRLSPVTSRKGGIVEIGGRKYIDFSSNDYLGLSDHPEIKVAAIKAIQEYGLSSSASRLMTGDYGLHHRLEQRVALFKNKEAALVFNSGYQANVGIISALFKEGDAIFADKLVHASIIDAMLLSGARIFRFRHNDAEHLRDLLSEQRGNFKNCLIVTETVFSMDGDQAPLPELVRLKEKYDSVLMVDEAHATGIFGKNGSGIVEGLGLSDSVDLIMGTFSKALGGFGAYLAASRETIDYLINTCRSFIYSTALPPYVIASNLASLDIIEKEPWRRNTLMENVGYFRDSLTKSGISVKGASQIVPVMTWDNFKALSSSGALKELGYWVLAIRPPTVPKGQSRLRFSLTVNHNREVLKRLIDEIGAIGI